MKKSKKGNAVVIVIIIVVMVIAAVVIGWLFLKKSLLKRWQTTKQESDGVMVIPVQKQAEDTVLVNKENGIYEINLNTKELRPYNNPVGDLKEFSGLPKEIKNNNISVSNSVRLLSQDKSKAIVVSVTYDLTKPQSDLDSLHPVIKGEEFICDTATKKCSPTEILEVAYKIVDGNWYSGYDGVWWHNWDSSKNLLYGHMSGEGIGNASPVYVFDINNKVLQKTIGYDSSKNEKRALVPKGAFSPSLSKFVMIYGDNAKSKWNLLLYDSNDLSAPVKSIDITKVNNRYDSGGAITSVAWSAAENMLILENDKQVYTLNLDSEKIELKYETDLWLDPNGVYLSQSGRYIVFIERNESDDDKINTVLKAVDIQNNNAVVELLRENGLTLGYRY